MYTGWKKTTVNIKNTSTIKMNQNKAGMPI